MGWITKQKEIKQNDNDDNGDGIRGEEAAAAATREGNQNNVLRKANKLHENSSGLPIDMTDETVVKDEIPQVIYALRTHSQITQGK